MYYLISCYVVLCIVILYNIIYFIRLYVKNCVFDTACVTTYADALATCPRVGLVDLHIVAKSARLTGIDRDVTQREPKRTACYRMPNKKAWKPDDDRMH